MFNADSVLEGERHAQRSLNEHEPCLPLQNTLGCSPEISHIGHDPHKQRLTSRQYHLGALSNPHDSQQVNSVVLHEPVHQGIHITEDILCRSNFYQPAPPPLPRIASYRIPSAPETTFTSPATSPPHSEASSSRLPIAEFESSSHNISRESSTLLQRSRKISKRKPYIELAPDQPPTALGKPRERVFVACVQW